VNRDDGVEPVVFAAQHTLGLRHFDLRLERPEPRLQVGGDVFAALGPLDEHAEIVLLFLERVRQVDVVLQAAAALQGLLGLGLILPEVRLGYTVFEAGNLLTQVGCLKDNSAVRRTAPRG
jgi:hypothetical protein